MKYIAVTKQPPCMLKKKKSELKDHVVCSANASAVH